MNSWREPLGSGILASLPPLQYDFRMSAAKKLNRISVEDYLADELDSPIKHEYLGGAVYAMAGARNVHNRIASNALGFLLARLRGKRCQPFNSDTKVRIRVKNHWRFYYPDTMVVCRENPGDDSFQDEPSVLVEVISKKTRRIDEGEKKDAYLTIPSLSVYMLIEQDIPELVVYRRIGDEFVREVYDGLNAVVPLPEIETELPLSEVYDRIEFQPEAEEET
jgi:Uma2 family endonuclease